MTTFSHTPQDEILIKRLIQIVLDNLNNEQFGVTELSDQIGMSRSHLHRKLTRIRDQSISQFIREIRLIEARKLLLQKNITASEVSYRVGFNSPSYFNTCFHEYYGFPPGEIMEHIQESVDFVETTIDSNLEKSSKENIPGKVSRHSSKLLWMAVSGFLITSLIFLIVYFFPWKNNRASIVVLPLKNLSNNTEMNYLADAVVDNILTQLSNIKGLEVKSRISSDKINKAQLSAREIAKELGVSYILEGSIIPENEKIWINIQLISAKKDDHVWAKNFDKDFKGVHSFISDISRQISEELIIFFLPEERIQGNIYYTSHNEAYNLYLEGRFYYQLRTRESFIKSIELYNLALTIDSNFCLAYAGLADSYVTGTYYGNFPRKEGIPKSREYALKALSINKNLAESHATLGGIASYFDYDYQKAEKELQFAMKLKPDYARAYKLYSELMHITGNIEKARKFIDKAIELQPSYPNLLWHSALYYYSEGEFEKALSEMEKCIILDIEQSNIYYRKTFFIYLIQHKYSEAIGEYKKYFIATYPDRNVSFLDSIISVSGYEEAILRFIEMERESNSYFYNIATMYAAIDYKDAAIDCLEKSFNRGEGIIVRMKYDIAFKNLATDKRFIELLRKMNLADD